MDVVVEPVRSLPGLNSLGMDVRVGEMLNRRRFTLEFPPEVRPAVLTPELGTPELLGSCCGTLGATGAC